MSSIVSLECLDESHVEIIFFYYFGAFCSLDVLLLISVFECVQILNVH